MKKGIYIIEGDPSLSAGVNKKICSQIKAFNKAGFQMVPYKISKEGMINKILCRLPFTNIYPKWNINTDISENDFIYLRKPVCINRFFIKFIKNIKEKNPDIKIIMEIPTYPYDKEMLKYIRNWPFYIKEIASRKKLKRNVDAIALLSDEKEVFGVKTLKIKNGLDFDDTRKRYFSTNKDSIDIAIIAMFHAWHGYERLIKGLYQYYQEKNERKVNLHFVGDGPELKDYKKMVTQYRLSERVRFYGLRDKAFIEKIYDICDIGASSFGLYKINLDQSYTLKSHEYLSVGLPVICAGKMDVMEYPGFEKYILEFPNNDSSISIDKIVGFYDNIYRNKDMIDDIITHIHDTAVNNLNMKESLKNVFEFLN